MSDVTDFIKKALTDCGFDPANIKHPLLKTVAGQFKTLTTLIDGNPKAQNGVKKFLDYVKEHWNG